MKLKFKNFEQDIDFNNLVFFIVKSQHFLRKIFHCFKNNEYDEIFTIFENLKANEIFFIESLFSFNLNEKALVTQLEKYLTKTFKKDIETAITKIEDIVNDFNNEVQMMLEFDVNSEIVITSKEILKMANNSFLENSFEISLKERILYIAKVLKELVNLKILVIFMPFLYFNLDELNELQYELKQMQIDIVFLDRNEIQLENSDKNSNGIHRFNVQQFILDEDLFSFIK